MIGGSNFMRDSSIKIRKRKRIFLSILVIAVMAIIILIWPLEKRVVSVSNGGGHIMAITSDGTLWSWGDNVAGERMDRESGKRDLPQKVMDDIITVSTGRSHTVLIDKNKELWGAGIGIQGQLGTVEYSTYTPIKMMNQVAAVSAGDSHTVAVTLEGDLYFFGLPWETNGYYYDPTGPSPRPLWTGMAVKMMEDVASVSAGNDYVMAVKKNGELWGWGEQ